MDEAAQGQDGAPPNGRSGWTAPPPEASAEEPRDRPADGWPLSEDDAEALAAVFNDAIADNWGHRSARMRCETCMWFVPKQGRDGQSALGRCRRRAPTLDGWPAVFVTDRCGDHKLDEEWA